jgi:hypothetical protein
MFDSGAYIARTVFVNGACVIGCAGLPPLYERNERARCRGVFQVPVVSHLDFGVPHMAERGGNGLVNVIPCRVPCAT